MRLSNPERVAYGDAIVARVGKPPAPLKDDFAAFKAQHVAFCAAGEAVAACEKAFDKVMATIGPLDVKRDKTILEMADKAPAHGLGTRASPFGKLTSMTPGKLVKLPYAVQTGAVNDLLAAIKDASPPPEIAKLCARLADENQAVDAALKALTAPADALSQARSKRDALLPDWDKALRHLKDSAKVALRGVAGRFDEVFAPVVAVQSTARRVRKVTAKVASAPTPEGAAPAAAPKKTKRRRK